MGISCYIEMAMRILVTGGTGFVGANLVHYFVRHDEEVHLTVRSGSDYWRLGDIQKEVTLHPLDLTDRERTMAFVGSLKPDIVLHCATYGAYQGREQDPELTMRTNVLGTMNLLDAALSVPLRCFINTGSSSEYGIKERPMDESDPLEPTSLYGVSKASATLLAQLKARMTSAPVVSMRLFSPYGPYEDGRRFMPVVINAYLRGGAPTLIAP